MPDWDMMLQYEICDDSDDHPCDPALLNAFAGGGMGGGGGGHRNLLLRGGERDGTGNRTGF